MKMITSLMCFTKEVIKVKEILREIDEGMSAAEMCNLLMDEKVTTNNMFEELVVAYDKGNDDFKAGMDKVLQILIWKDMQELVDHMKKEAKA